MRLRRAIYIALFIASLVLISIYGGTVSYAFFFALLFIPVLSYAYLIAVFSQFKIYQKLESRDVVANTPMGYYFILKNDSFISFSSIQLRMWSSFSEIDELPPESEFCLLPGEEYRYETRIMCKYRGEYEVGIKEVILTDFLRLFRFKYKIPSTLNAIVSPKVVSMPVIDSIDEAVAKSYNEELYKKETLDTIVREYVPGDSYRNINWKISAKEGRLMTRQTNGEKKQGVGLIFDSKRYSGDMQEYLPLEDRMLGVMLALLVYLTKKDILPDLYCYNTPKRHLNSLKDFHSFYSSLGQFRFEENHSFADMLIQNRIAMSSYGILAIVVHEMDVTIASMIKEISNHGTYVLVYYVSEGRLPADVGEILSEESFRGKIVNVPVCCELEGGLS